MNSRNPRVLVIDDDPSILEVVEIALTERGYEVLLADDGAEGLSRVERDKPDLVVLDMVMPRRSGMTVLERLKQWGPRSPHIIVLSASDHPKQREFAMECGAEAFLSKPVDIDVLADHIDQLLGDLS
jgi:two-component system response regulator MprA